MSLEPTRRAALKLIAGIGAFLAAPFHKTLAAPAVRKPLSLHDQVQAQVDALTPETINAALDGTYAKVFTRVKSTMQVERTVQFRLSELDAKYGAVRVRDREDALRSPSHFVFNAWTYELGFAFAVVADDDPRAVGVPSANSLKLPSGKVIDRPGILTLPQIKQEPAAVQPWHLRDLPVALSVLMGVFKEARESDAAQVLNRADTYDASIGGDGVSLCSRNHPCDEGRWANTFVTQCDLNSESLKAGLDHVSTQFVDEANLKIVADGTRLVVPSSMRGDAGRALAALDPLAFPKFNRELIAWDHLTNPWHWFLTTTIAGLKWFERSPFEFNVWHDAATGLVIVMGYERRCFQYTDPRAVFGSLPSA